MTTIYDGNDDNEEDDDEDDEDDEDEDDEDDSEDEDDDENEDENGDEDEDDDKNEDEDEEGLLMCGNSRMRSIATLPTSEISVNMEAQELLSERNKVGPKIIPRLWGHILLCSLCCATLWRN